MKWYKLTLSSINNQEIDRLQQRLFQLGRAAGDKIGGPANGAALFGRSEGDYETLYFTEPAVKLLGAELANHQLEPCETPDPGGQVANVVGSWKRAWSGAVSR